MLLACRVASPRVIRAPTARTAVRTAASSKPPTAAVVSSAESAARTLGLADAFRRDGHLLARSNPLVAPTASELPQLAPARYGLDATAMLRTEGLVHGVGAQASVASLVQHLTATYCGPVGAEFQHLDSAEERAWLQQQCEQRLPKYRAEISDQKRHYIHTLLHRSEAMDQFLSRKHPTHKRYGLEGCESMMACMDAVFDTAAAGPTKNVVISMPHRGRLNFLVGMLHYPHRSLFHKIAGGAEFDDSKFLGSGDIPTHIARSIDLPEYGDLHVSVVHNPSHLEASHPVAMGKARSKQTRAKDAQHTGTMCMLLHGDAAMAGQGVTAEALQLSQVADFAIGGVVHVVVNNQLGFTTPSSRGHSMRHSTDLLKSINCPAFHVNADDPEAVVVATRIAVEYKQKFQKDVAVNLIGYRRRGHNEVDEPSFTQPTMYQDIKARPTVYATYTQELVSRNLLTPAEVQKREAAMNAMLEAELAASVKHVPESDHLAAQWSGLVQTRTTTDVVDTGVAAAELRRVGAASVDTKASLHARLETNFVKPRLDVLKSGADIDWATAEALAFGSLLSQGYSVRLSGQDVLRGTFSHRHVGVWDQKSGALDVPLKRLAATAGTNFEAVNSPLSEYAVSLFEYGFAMDDPKSLVLWEAQFGDFFNVAQVAADQYLCSGEEKWLRQNGMVFLLPHGYDGAGPEHSSCRIERWLQQTSTPRSAPSADAGQQNCNMLVVNPSTPAQYFHLLRRQMLRNYRKPLIVVAPKTLLRLAACTSSLSEMEPGTHFKPVLADPAQLDAQAVTRVILCSGKIFFELDKARTDKGNKTTALVRVEELAPFPFAPLAAELAKYPNASSAVWVQEEPENMGAWTFAEPRILSVLPQRYSLSFVAREPSGAVATGIYTQQAAQVKALFTGLF